MTPVQIAYFKHFLFDKGIAKTYIFMYRRNRIKGGPEGDKNSNPESLEQFLREQPYFRVVMHAFYFQMNSDYGYEFWDSVNRQWKKYWDIHEDNFSNISYANLKGTFAILKQNWDSDRYWQVETPEETYKRMGIEPPPDKEININKLTSKTPRFSEGDILQSTLSGEFRKVAAIGKSYYLMDDDSIIDFDKEDYWTLVEPDFEKVDEPEEKPTKELQAGNKELESDDLDGFSEVKTHSSHGGKRIKHDMVSVNLRNGGYRITFSMSRNSNFQKHGYKYVKLLSKEDTREIALLFNDSDGYKSGIKTNGKTRNTVINSKDIVEYIQKFYKLKDEYFILDITGVVEKINSTMFKLKYGNGTASNTRL